MTADIDRRLPAIVEDWKEQIVNRSYLFYVSLSLMLLSASMLLIDYGPIFLDLSNDVRIDQRKFIQNHTTQSGKNRPETALAGPVDSTGFAFLLKEYDTAVQEIRMRLEQESLLFSLKFSLVGAILAMLLINISKTSREFKAKTKSFLSKSPEAACLCWAAVVTSAIVDTRILFHNDFIAMLGTWIRLYVEPKLLGSHMIGWETFLYPNSALFESLCYPLLRSNTTVLTLMLFAYVTYVFSGSYARADLLSSEQDSVGHYASTRRLCFTGSVLSYAAFFLVNSHYHYTSRIWIICGLGWMIIGMLSSYCLWRNLPPTVKGVKLSTRSTDQEK